MTPAETTPTTLRDREPGAEAEVRTAAVERELHRVMCGGSRHRSRWTAQCIVMAPNIARGLVATLDAAREQAATEARRELLAKVEGLPTRWVEFYDGNPSVPVVSRAAVLALFEEPSGWDAAMQDPAFVAALDEGMADVAAGRVSPYSPDSPAAWQGHNHALETFGGNPVPLPFPDCPKCESQP